MTAFACEVVATSLLDQGRSISFPTFAESLCPPPRAEGEPPRKKIRRGEDHASVQRSADGSFLGHVALLHLSLRLDCRRFSHEEPETSGEVFSGEARPVNLTGVEEAGAGAFRLELQSQQQPWASITIRATTSKAQEAISHLEHVRRWSRQTSSASLRAPPARSYCTIRFEADAPAIAHVDAWVLWREGVSAVDFPSAFKDHARLLHESIDDARRDDDSDWALFDFYESVHVPPREAQVARVVQDVHLDCDLYPFQQRAVQWLLKREKVGFADGGFTSTADEEAALAPSCFRKVIDACDRRFFLSDLQGLFLDRRPRYPDLHGGILCEEMGLGKTVELLALISLHRRDNTPSQAHEQLVDTSLAKAKATLIISPPHILQQWQSEIARHAPHLKVLNYIGMQAASRTKDDSTSEVQTLLEYDIVLTTYNVLSREIHYAEPPPERNFRHAKRHEARRSPLVQISWWRVCLDEAQMIEGGVSKAATVARLCPRINAWAVSGTPLKKDLDDLFGLILFLWLEPFCLSKKIWSRMDKTLFRKVIGHIAMRHTKDFIRQELRIPEQKRVVLTMPFTAIEEQNYSQLLQQMSEDCGLTIDGAPSTDDIDFTSPVLIEKMRSWLRRLRQTCLHPQVGGKNRKALGRRGGPLKTVNEVLDTLIEQNETMLRAEQRQVVLSQIRHTHVLANDKSNPDRWPAALETYKASLAKATEFVEVVRKELQVEKARNATRTTPDPSASDSETDSDVEDQQEKNGRVAALQKALRAALEVRHVAAFFVGTAYYQLKIDESRIKPESEEFHAIEKLETEAYEDAKKMRKEMLLEWDEAAQRSMRKVAAKREKYSVAKVPRLEDLGGIESRKYLAKLDQLGDVLDRNAEHLKMLYFKSIEHLLLDLIDQDDGKDTTGEEYEDSTKKQDELPVYITMLRAAVADRHRLLTGQANFLVDSETKDAAKLAKDGEGHAPELLLKLLEERKTIFATHGGPGNEATSLRDVITQIRSTITALEWSGGDDGSTRAGRELAIVERQLHEAQRISSTQSKAVADLEKDLELFRHTMNQRNEFYRQLQVISDTVAPYKEELDETLDTVALQKEASEQEKSEKKLATLSTKHRFLLHLKNESTSTEEARICVICQATFELGVLTVCGHQYCKDCISIWWRQHRTCPVCKRHLRLVDFHDITYKPSELLAKEEHAPTALQSSQPNHGEELKKPSSQIYTSMNASTLKEIKSIDLNHSYGTKIDTIARHVLWIREHDPGAKSIIFSQFGDFLQVLGGALRSLRIGYASYSDKGGVERFKREAGVECLLLDAKSDSSGLNLVDATNVFFCEPLINAAIELQAIARVHRIGQQRSTAVYMYLTSDTVEESIYDISVARRMAHLGQTARVLVPSSSRSGTATPKQNPLLEETALEAANSLELQQAPVSTLLVKGRGGGEVVQQSDLWQCLFGRARLARREAVSGEMATEVNRFLRAEAADERAARAADDL